MENDDYICTVYYDLEHPEAFETCKKFLSGFEVYVLSRILLNVPDHKDAMTTHQFNFITLAMVPEVQSMLIEFLEPYEHIWINQDPPQIADYV